MMKRGLCLRPQASDGETQLGAFCGTGNVSQSDEWTMRTGSAARDETGDGRAGAPRDEE